MALSGGSDSTALLLLALDARRELGLELFAATVDHRLRPEGRAEAEAVAALCRDRDVPHAILTWTEPKPEANLQAEAREARARLLSEWRRSIGVRTLALGHTLDDVAETFLIRLARGSGVDGLARMAEARDQIEWGRDQIEWGVEPTLRLIRPLLGLRREALRAVCRAEGVGWVEDPSNEDRRFLRARARAALAALEPLDLGPERLAKTASTMERARSALEHEATALLRRAASVEPTLGLARLNAEILRTAPRELSLRALARVLEWTTGAVYPPRLDALEAALEAVLDGKGGRSLHGAQLAPLGKGEYGQWAAYREPAAAAAPSTVADGSAVWDGRFRLEAAGRAAAMLGALGEAGRIAVERRLKEAQRAPPARWKAAPIAARRSAPAVFDAAGDVLHAPAAGVVASGWRLSLLRPAPWERQSEGDGLSVER